MDEVRGKSFIEQMSESERTPESAIKRELPGFLLGNSICGEGSSSQACNVPMQNGISSKDEEVLEVRPVKVRRKMIDLQLPPDEYLNTDGENTGCPPYEQSKAGKEVGEKLFLERGNASYRNGSSGSSLFMKNPNGLTDLNEPVQCQESVPVPSSRDIYSLYGRNIAHVQGQWLEKSTSQNGWTVPEAGEIFIKCELHVLHFHFVSLTIESILKSSETVLCLLLLMFFYDGSACILVSDVF